LVALRLQQVSLGLSSNRCRIWYIAVSFHLHLDTEHVQHIYQDEPLCVEPEVLIHEVLSRLKDYKKGSILICRDGKLQGVFTERDALRLMAAGADLAAPIHTVMTKDPVTTSVSETVGSAIQKMAVGGYRRLPVVDDSGTPVGLLRVNHILHYLVEHFPEVVYNLPPKPHHSTQEREGA